jgi:hypothetical protein
VPELIEAPVSAETLSSVDAPDPAGTPNPPDADDSAASPNIANMANTTSFFFIMLILQFLILFLINQNYRLPKPDLMKTNTAKATYRRRSNLYAIYIYRKNQGIKLGLRVLNGISSPTGDTYPGASIKRLSYRGFSCRYIRTDL